MQIAVIHHVAISSPHTEESGASIRLRHLCQGLVQHDPEISFTFLCKSEVEGNWQTHIHQWLLHTAPDVILCAQMDDVALLPDRSLFDAPVIVDLYAPRLMETLYEADHGTTSHHLLLALDRADAYMVAHELQQDHWTALMRLVGVTEIESRILITPLGVDMMQSNPTESLTLVGGGRVWPWQNPWNNLSQLLNVLDHEDAGHVHWFSPPDQPVPIQHSRLTVHPWGSRDAYRSVISQSTFGLDLNPDSPERYLACAFRHMEFLGCGVPILSANQNILTRSEPKLCQSIDFENTKELVAALSYRASLTTLKRFQQAHAPKCVVESLWVWLQNPTCRSPEPHAVIYALQPQQQEFSAQTRLLELETQITQLEATRTTQTRLLEEANLQVQQSSASLLKVTTAMEQISAFKNDIAHTWSNVMQQQQDLIQSLQSQVADLQADNAKKSAELHAMDLLRARLENDLQHLREQMEQPKPRWRR